VQGTLAVTRGIGDAHLKPWVVAEPETATVDLDERCELLILASDGLWDKVGNQEAVDAARVAAACTDGLPAACRRLVEMAAARGSTDDISVVIVQLQRQLR
jgi:protein phosphatase 1L